MGTWIRISSRPVLHTSNQNMKYWDTELLKNFGIEIILLAQWQKTTDTNWVCGCLVSTFVPVVLLSLRQKNGFHNYNDTLKIFSCDEKVTTSSSNNCWRILQKISKVLKTRPNSSIWCKSQTLFTVKYQKCSVSCDEYDYVTPITMKWQI
jgi:hypothetical protein